MTRQEYAVRCADGHLIDEEPWDAVADVDRNARMWDRDCDCGGPHKVMFRKVTVTEWEPFDE